MTRSNILRSLDDISHDLESGSISCQELVDSCLKKIADASGEGERAFVFTDVEGAKAQAVAMDQLRANNAAPSRFAGIPISIKDLFDVQGQRTGAGSVVLNDREVSVHDSNAVARLRAAGFVLIGRTNMTEFAYSGLGMNPHYGTPLNPYDRQVGRIPGGSSSGGAVSVTDGMAAAGLGTDTGGSCRIPAAFCGITGFKPTASRVPMGGVVPLSQSLDSIGSLAPTAKCCAVIDSVLSGQKLILMPDVFPLTGLRIGALNNYVLDGMDSIVAETYAAALGKLRAAGAHIIDINLAPLNDLPMVNSKGGFAAAEAYAVHRVRLEKEGSAYDPRVSVRIRKGAEQSAADYLDLLASRKKIIRQVNRTTSSFDLVVFPTVPIIAPKLAELKDEDEYGRLNLLCLRNSTVANFLNRCAVSLPIHCSGDAPVGLTLMGETCSDRRLLSIAVSIESIFL